MSRKTARTSPNASREQGRFQVMRTWWWLAGILVAVAAGWYWWNERPAALYQSARKLSATNPAEAEELAVAAIVQAGGSYPDAELFHALLSARRQQWTTALAAFRLIRNPWNCDGSELLELTERAVAAREFALTGIALEAAQRNQQVQSDPGLLKRLLIIQHSVSSGDLVLQSCQALSRLSPEDWQPWSIRADIEQRSGQLAAAVTSLRQALALSPPAEDGDRLQLTLAERLMDLGELSEARIELDKLLSRGSPSRQCWLREAYLRRLEGHSEQALAAAEQVLQLAPGSSSGLLIRGILRQDAGDSQGAVVDLQGVVSQEPFRKEAHHKLGQALFDTGDEENGRKHLARARELAAATDELLALNAQESNSPPDVNKIARLIELNRRIGRFDEAERWNSIRISLRPQSPR